MCNRSTKSLRGGSWCVVSVQGLSGSIDPARGRPFRNFRARHSSIWVLRLRSGAKPSSLRLGGNALFSMLSVQHTNFAKTYYRARCTNIGSLGCGRAFRAAAMGGGILPFSGFVRGGGRDFHAPRLPRGHRRSTDHSRRLGVVRVLKLDGDVDLKMWQQRAEGCFVLRITTNTGLDCPSGRGVTALNWAVCSGLHHRQRQRPTTTGGR